MALPGIVSVAKKRGYRWNSGPEHCGTVVMGQHPCSITNSTAVLGVKVGHLLELLPALKIVAGNDDCVRLLGKHPQFLDASDRFHR